MNLNRHIRFQPIAFVMLLLALAIGLSLATAPAQATPSPQVLGKTFGEWEAQWCKWVLSIPAATNPMIDETGEFCDINQQGPVWFLAGFWGEGSATRSCTIPASKHIFFPIVNSWWIQMPGDQPDTEMGWRQILDDFLSPLGGGLECTLDEKPVVFNPMTPIVRTQSAVFTATFPDDNFYNLSPSDLNDYPIVADGFYVMLPPLSPGSHTLHFRAEGDGNVFQDVTYELTVSPAGKTQGSGFVSRHR